FAYPLSFIDSFRSRQPPLQPCERIVLHLDIELMGNVVELPLETLRMSLVGKDGANLLDRRLHAGSRKQTVSSAVLHKDGSVGRCQRCDVRMIQIGVRAERVEESRMDGVGNIQSRGQRSHPAYDHGSADSRIQTGQVSGAVAPAG